MIDQKLKEGFPWAQFLEPDRYGIHQVMGMPKDFCYGTHDDCNEGTYILFLNSESEIFWDSITNTYWYQFFIPNEPLENGSKTYYQDDGSKKKMRKRYYEAYRQFYVGLFS